MNHIVILLRGQILVSPGLCKLIPFSSSFFINIKINDLEKTVNTALLAPMRTYL